MHIKYQNLNSHISDRSVRVKFKVKEKIAIKFKM